MRILMAVLFLAATMYADTMPTSFVDLNGRTWRIELKEDEDVDFAGYTDTEHAVVYLNKESSDIRETLFHELFHVVLGTKSSRQKGNVHGFIYVSSPRLLHLLGRNPQLVKFIMEATAENDVIIKVK